MKNDKQEQLVPKLRFKGFTEVWEQSNIAKLLKSNKLGGNYKNNDIPTSKPLIKMGNISRGVINLNKIQYISE